MINLLNKTSEYNGFPKYLMSNEQKLNFSRKYWSGTPFQPMNLKSILLRKQFQKLRKVYEEKLKVQKIIRDLIIKYPSKNAVCKVALATGGW